MFAVLPVARLDEAFDFGQIQSIHGAFALAWSLEFQTSARLFHHILGLVVVKMVLTPQSSRLLDDFIHLSEDLLRVRFCIFTTHFGGFWRVQIGHVHLDAFPEGMQKCAVSEFCALRLPFSLPPCQHYPTDLECF